MYKSVKVNNKVKNQELKPDKTRAFIEKVFFDGTFTTSGLAFAEILPDISRFTFDNAQSKARRIVEKKLNEFFDRFYNF